MVWWVVPTFYSCHESNGIPTPDTRQCQVWVFLILPWHKLLWRLQYVIGIRSWPIHGQCSTSIYWWFPHGADNGHVLLCISLNLYWFFYQALRHVQWDLVLGMLLALWGVHSTKHCQDLCWFPNVGVLKHFNQPRSLIITGGLLSVHTYRPYYFQEPHPSSFFEAYCSEQTQNCLDA